MNRGNTTCCSLRGGFKLLRDCIEQASREYSCICADVEVSTHTDGLHYSTLFLGIAMLGYRYTRLLIPSTDFVGSSSQLRADSDQLLTSVR